MSQQKRRKHYHNYKKQRLYTLEPGQKGFLCTCNSREKDCIRESYNILNKYADNLYGTEELDKTESKDDNNVEDELKRELEEMKSTKENVKSRRFQLVESGAKNVLFIRSSVDDPVDLVTNIINDIQKSKQCQSKFLIRLVPIEVTCKAYIETIKSSLDILLIKHFKDTSRTFSIIYNHRNNNNVNKDELIKEVADLVMKTRNDHVVNLKNPEICIIIEIIKSIAMLSVVPNYVQFKKFNLQELYNLNAKSADDITDDVKNSLEDKNSEAQ